MSRQVALIATSLFLVLSVAGTAPARDTRHLYPLDAVLASTIAKEKLGAKVAFFFGTQPHPQIVRELGNHLANRKTNAFNKSDREACDWAFLSALLALRDRAISEGGDAVVNIHSFYKKNPFVSQTEYECHAGAMIAGVALKGTVVTLQR